MKDLEIFVDNSGNFYLFWYHGLYFNTKSIELAMDPVNMIFTFFINLGAVVVYTVIVNSMAEFFNIILIWKKKKKQLSEIENLVLKI
ncbi:MAG: hypothetical protein ACLUR5_05040 [Eubacterium ventriosum]